MFDFLKKRNKKPAQNPTETSSTPSLEQATNSSNSDSTATSKAAPQAKPTFGSKVRQGLSKTRYQFKKNFHQVFQSGETLNDSHFRAIKDALLEADVGLKTSKKIIESLKAHCQQHGVVAPHEMFTALQKMIIDLLQTRQSQLTLLPNNRPFVILMVGVNGAGKTTTIGKLSQKFQALGHSVMLAAGDTFRAAAIEQLQAWGERHNIPVVAQKSGADSGAVIFDALQSAQHKNIDILLADTAGRLHTKHNLMEELKKVKRVLKKISPEAPHETLLVLDAAIGQNSLQQALTFHEALDVSGIIMTKLDGTAKGGVLLAIADQLNVPIYMIGVGEQAEDLQDFDAKEFVAAILPTLEEFQS